MKIFITSILILSLSFPAFADKASWEKYRNYTPQQINAFSEKDRDDVPFSYIGMAIKASYSKGELEIKSELQKLMYPGLHDYAQAVREFQKDLGESVTGELTVWQLGELEFRSRMQTIPAVSFPNGLGELISSNEAHVAGMMISDGEELDQTINYAWVNCVKSKKICNLSEIYLEVPVKEREDFRYRLSQAEPAIYKITQWKDGHIEAVLVRESQECMRSSISLNFQKREYQLSKKNIVPLCGFVIHRGKTEPLMKELATIVDGRGIIREKLSQLFDSRELYLSSSFRKQKEEARKELYARPEEQTTNPPPLK